MAMFHLSTNPIKRSAGRSATASAAYRAGCKIEDNRTGLKHDYSKKQGIVKTDCFIFSNGQKLNIDRSELWNAAEKAEKRKDGRTAREVIINLPYELNEEQRQSLVEDFTKDISKKYKVAIDYAIHLPDKHGDRRNHHAHILMTTRAATLENNTLVLGDKTNIELSNTKLAKLNLPKTQEQIVNLRRHWANTTNKHLENAGIDRRIDHRSYEEQGSYYLPTVKLGWEASALERKGISTAKGDINRQVANDNLESYIINTELESLKEQLAKQQEEKERTIQTTKPPSPLILEPKLKPKKVEAKDIDLDKHTQESFERLHQYHNQIVDGISEGQSPFGLNMIGKKFLEYIDYIGIEAGSQLYDRGLDNKRLENIDEVISTSKTLLANVDSMSETAGFKNKDFIKLYEKAITSLDKVEVEFERVSARRSTPTQSLQPTTPQNTPRPR
jgi:hypothetical protein|tara:strand:- start:181 stop:1512 length:1332 start_codon:yes stop_codon:yes gene_type:complete